MRIISGEYRGRRLKAPRGLDTRPMLGRVREAVFSALGGDFDGWRALDLFSGTGSLGLEILSRGGTYVRFLERDRVAAGVLRENLETLGATDRSEVWTRDALDPRSFEHPDGPGWADVVFLDPPYPFLRDQKQRPRVLEAARALTLETLAPGGTCVLHTHPRDLGAEDLGEGLAVDRRTYGNSAIFLLTPA